MWLAEVREERLVNFRMQKQLLELLTGKKLNIDLPDELNPVLVELTSRVDEVSASFLLLLNTFDIVMKHDLFN